MFVQPSVDAPLGASGFYRVGTMLGGRLVETGTRDDIFGNPQEAYTRQLIDAVPVPDPRHRRHLTEPTVFSAR